MTERTTRRRLLATVGAGAAVAIAGCSSSGAQDAETTTNQTTSTTADETTTNQTTTQQTTAAAQGPRYGDDLPADQTPEDGYPPSFDASLPDRNVDPATFETISRSGTEVPLVPIDVAYYWYVNGEARFVDARGATEYEHSHVLGAVNSPAGDGEDHPDDPVFSWPTDDRIVTYCACPHHLSSLRAASLMNRGYDRVYAIDEGYTEWRERDYPMAGSNPADRPSVATIEGETDPADAGETAWAYAVESDQTEATTIAGDGSYELRLKFVNVTGDTRIRIETPSYTVRAPLSKLVDGTVTADGTVATRRAPAGLSSLRFW